LLLVVLFLVLLLLLLLLFIRCDLFAADSDRASPLSGSTGIVSYNSFDDLRGIDPEGADCWDAVFEGLGVGVGGGLLLPRRPSLFHSDDRCVDDEVDPFSLGGFRILFVILMMIYF
jgi:hypothetical protein